jgi:hypothetical protein
MGAGMAEAIFGAHACSGAAYDYMTASLSGNTDRNCQDEVNTDQCRV